MKSKELKRAEAAERQERYDALTPLDKELQATLRPGRSRRELQRLNEEKTA
jgi:hypothetical protein